jgi:hypothetical protein
VSGEIVDKARISGNSPLESTLTSMENTLEYKLANAYMDQSELEAAAPLIGALAGDEPTTQSLVTQARFAFLRGPLDAAVELMRQAREQAGDHWLADYEDLLQSYLSGDTRQ